MKYFIKLLKTLLYPVILLFGEFFVQYVFIFLFNRREINFLNHKYPDLNQTQIINKLNKVITTKQYQNRLSNYLNNKTLFIVIIAATILIPLFMMFYKKYKTKVKKVKLSDIIIIVLLGMSVSTIFNVTIFELNNLYHFTNNYKLNSISLLVQILSSGLIGPILEELVFRGIVYNKLKQFNSNMKSIVLTSIIFALFHISNPLNIIYAFMISFFFIYLYEKYKGLRYPIIMHVSANTTTILIMYIMTKQIIWINIILWVISLIILIIIYIKIIKKDAYKFKNNI